VSVATHLSERGNRAGRDDVLEIRKEMGKRTHSGEDRLVAGLLFIRVTWQSPRFSCRLIIERSTPSPPASEPQLAPCLHRRTTAHSKSNSVLDDAGCLGPRAL
jgi:hypothetical protein